MIPGYTIYTYENNKNIITNSRLQKTPVNILYIIIHNNNIYCNYEYIDIFLKKHLNVL